jgi:hypothetical protein
VSDNAVTVSESPSTAALWAALVKAQADLKNPPKDSVNPHFKSRYADLATVRDVIVPALAKHGLAVMQMPCEVDSDPALATRLVHSSGEWIQTVMRLRPQKPDPQGVGSALTYARRYALQAIANVAADEDDDGQAASRQQGQRPREQPAPRQPSPPQAESPRKVTAEELSELHALVGESGLKWTTWLKWLKGKGFPVTSSMSMADITADAYERMLPSLQKAIAEKKPAN